MSIRSCSRHLLAFLLLFSSAIIQANGPDAATVRQALENYNLLAPVALPMPDASQLELIARGYNVHIKERTAIDQADGKREDRIRVVGYKIVKRPRLLVWLATLDFDTNHSERLTEHHIENDDAGGSLWYQYLDTPWPVRNRHWVIRNAKNIELEKASEGLVWEHRWNLAPGGLNLTQSILRQGELGGLSKSDADKAIYLTVNRGAWTMMAIDEQNTLVVVHTIAVMGGWIPESWVASFVNKQLGDVLSNLEKRSDAIVDNYTGTYPIFTGSGKKITQEMAKKSRSEFLQILAGDLSIE